MRIRFIVSALGAVVVALAVGCGGGQGGGHSATSVAPSPTPTVGPTLALNRIDELLVPPEVVGDIVGSKLNWTGTPPPGWTRPPSPPVIDEGNPDCAALFGLDTNTVGVAYTGWRSNLYKEDKDTYEHAVRQAVATVVDSKAATVLLGNAFAKRLDACSNAVIHLSGKYRWRFQKTDATDTGVRWTGTELEDGQITGWVCASEARAKNNVVIYAQVCQWGNGAPAAATILDNISAKIPG
ncbi:sensor domain-containing protein, partial [Mycobacterium sp. E2497]|uniref:sensor domain-containing protein n=1 Tax=Mycobacterium sp. E2497 TaxID=1834135 RepID=UPI000AA39404